MTNKIGLLGGTFDPPHWGHLWLAETARAQLGLAKVLFLPVGLPPHKEGKGVTAVSHRLHLTQLAIQDIPYFELNTTDLDREPPQITVTLLPLLRQLYPEAELWWLIGSDSLRDFPTWHQPQQLIQLCRLAVLPRPEVVVDWVALKTAVPGIETAVDMLAGPQLNLSSTDIRQWAKAGHTIRHLLPTAVHQYIQANALYSPACSESC
ncbi:MAG: nicotinate (nicotinamide) nucleotide adenylyltransferase [Ardenticatenaceae bacterium]|nr:nicotinate (nicotinamide) nucleotide adenylyltransferase [Ardenticatenaceae bacterium]